MSWPHIKAYKSYSIPLSQQISQSITYIAHENHYLSYRQDGLKCIHFWTLKYSRKVCVSASVLFHVDRKHDNDWYSVHRVLLYVPEDGELEALGRLYKPKNCQFQVPSIGRKMLVQWLRKLVDACKTQLPFPVEAASFLITTAAKPWGLCDLLSSGIMFSQDGISLQAQRISPKSPHTIWSNIPCPFHKFHLRICLLSIFKGTLFPYCRMSTG